jgi:glutamate/aspartate transport system permease protein
MDYHWNWRIFFDTAPDGVGTYLDTLWSGLWWTLATAWTAWLMALLLGLIVGTLRSAGAAGGGWPVKLGKLLGDAWVELFRNVPLLVQMFLWFFVLPELLPAAAGAWLKSLPDAAFITAVLCLGFFTSARVAVQVTAGIAALPAGQQLAGTALGLTLPQTYRYVLLPMAARVMLPPLTSEFLNIIKNSSVALTIGLVELTASARAIQEFSFQVFEAFTAATLIYLIVNAGVLLLMRWIERRVAIPGHGVGAPAAVVAGH